jgi:hypothetical protein
MGLIQEHLLKHELEKSTQNDNASTGKKFLFAEIETFALTSTYLGKS